MLKFNRTLNVLKYDFKTYSASFEKACGEVFREAAREWLKTLLATNVPVETGMAKATLSKLGEFLHIAVDLIPTSKPTLRKGYRGIDGWTNIPNGRAKSRFAIMDDKSDPGAALFKFHWSTEVKHFWLQEYFRRPGNSQPAGEIRKEYADARFIEYINTNLSRRVPKFAQHMKVRKL